MGRPRFFRYGELPLVLLALLDREPRSGYELMAELDRLFRPDYRASPGSVYPALKALTAERLVTVVEDQGATTYAPSSAGRRLVEQRRDDLAAIEHRTGRRLGRGDELDAVLVEVGARVRAVAGRVADDVVVTELRSAATRIERAAHAMAPGEAGA